MNVPSIHISCLLCKVYIHIVFIYASLLWMITYWLFHPWHSTTEPCFFLHPKVLLPSWRWLCFLGTQQHERRQRGLAKTKKNMTEDMLKGCHFLINQPSGPHADPDLRCPERWRIWVRFHRSELAGHPGILKLSDFTRNRVLRLLQPPKHGDFSRTIQAPRFLWNEAIPLYPIVYDHLNPAMGQTQNRRSLP